MAPGATAERAPELVVLDAIERARGPITVESLREQLELPRRTLQRHLSDLLAQGKIERVRRGTYQLTGRTTGLDEATEAIIQVLDDVGGDAHITGFDALVPFAHQFVFEFPHLVYADPDHANSVAWELAARGFFVTPAGPSAQYTLNPGRTVVLREQANAETRYGIIAYLARPEKAWVDLVREVLRSRMPFQWTELGRVLANMEQAGVDMRWLRSYAKRTGYLDLVRVALGDALEDETDDIAAALAVGYRTS